MQIIIGLEQWNACQIVSLGEKTVNNNKCQQQPDRNPSVSTGYAKRIKNASRGIKNQSNQCSVSKGQMRALGCNKYHLGPNQDGLQGQPLSVSCYSSYSIRLSQIEENKGQGGQLGPPMVKLREVCRDIIQELSFERNKHVFNCEMRKNS